MLVLSRKVGEKLIIGENIVVEVVRVRGNRITLGLVAPDDVKIMRGELKKFVDNQAARAATQPEFNNGNEQLLKAC